MCLLLGHANKHVFLRFWIERGASCIQKKHENIAKLGYCNPKSCIDDHKNNEPSFHHMQRGPYVEERRE